MLGCADLAMDGAAEAGRYSLQIAEQPVRVLKCFQSPKHISDVRKYLFWHNYHVIFDLGIIL